MLFIFKNDIYLGDPSNDKSMFKRVFLNFILLLFILIIYSCTQKNKKHSFTENQEKIRFFYTKGLSLKYYDYSGMYLYADSISEAAIDENNNYKAMGLIVQGTYDLMIKDLTETFANYNKAEILLRKDGADSLKFAAHNGLGNYYNLVGDYPKSLEEHLKALKFAEDLGDTTKIAIVNSNLGQLYLQKGDADLAKLNLNNTLLLLKSKKHVPAYLIASHTLANMYGMAGDFDAALKIDEEGLRITDSIHSDHLKSTFLDNKANCFMYSGKLDSAEVYFKECLRLDILGNNKKQISDSYSNLAQLAMFSKNDTDVKKYAEKSIALSKEINYNPGLTKAYQTLIDFYTSQDNSEMVSEYQNLYLQVYKNLLNEKKEAAMVRFQVQYETEKKEKELLLSQVAISKKNTQLQISAISIVALFLISYLIYRQLKTKNRQQKQEFQLKTALKEIEVQNKLQEQRLDISRDLHDNIGAQLTFIISSVENLKFGLKNADSKCEKQLNRINTITRETIIELRDTIWAMNSHNFTFEDLRARSLNFMVKVKQTHPKLKFTFHIDEELKEIEISSVKGINIYRIIQEALNNAIKYSEANVVKVSIQKQKDKGITISILDDGKGFLIENTEMGNGILNMEKRAEDLNGTFSILSRPENGTEITINMDQIIDK